MLEDALARARRRGVADGGVRGRRRARRRGRGRGGRRPRRAGDHLHARQGPRPVRRRQGGPARPAPRHPARRRRCAREVRRAARSRSRTGSRSSATRADGFPGLPGFGAKTAAAVLRALRPPRGDPRRREGSGTSPACGASSGSRRRCDAGREVADALQGAGDAADRRRSATVDDWEWHGPAPGARRLVRPLRIAETRRPRREARGAERGRTR